MLLDLLLLLGPAPFLTTPPAASPELRLVAEAADGTVQVLGFAELPLTDPRSIGARLIRPEGFPRDERGLQGQLAELELAGGDRLRGRLAGGEGELVALEIRGGVVLTLTIEELSSIVVPALLPARLDEPLTAPEEGDRLFRRTGVSLDRIDGTVEAFTEEGVRFDSLLGSKVFPWDEVAALFVEVLEGGDGSSPPEGVPVVLDLVDGSRLRGRLDRLDVQGVSVRIGSSRTPVLLAWEHVQELLVDDGVLAFLSALTPVREEGRGTPFDDGWGMSWPHRVDRCVVGGPLESGGQVFSRGIGAHAPTRIAWRVDPRWDELRGLVAVDDSSLFNAQGARGSVIFRIELEGELLWESPLVRGGDPPRALPSLALGPAQEPRELVLVVDPVDDFRGDRANWLRMLLVDRE